MVRVWEGLGEVVWDGERLRGVEKGWERLWGLCGVVGVVRGCGGGEGLGVVVKGWEALGGVAKGWEGLSGGLRDGEGF